MAGKVYEIRLHSPMGIKQGQAIIRPKEGRMVLDILGGENLFRGNFTLEYGFELAGTLKTAARDISGVLRGSVSDKIVQAVFHTEEQDFLIEGVAREYVEQQ